MKVFINKLSLSENYCGGLIIVAANSAAEAHGVMCMSGNYSRNYLPDKWQELAEIEKKDFMDKYDCDEDDIGVEELYWMIAIFSPKDNAVTTYEIHNGYLL